MCGPHSVRLGGLVVWANSHVDLEFAAAQLVPEMLAQRVLVDLQLLGDVGLSEAESRSVLDRRLKRDLNRK
jgi:hypothetical protein